MSENAEQIEFWNGVAGQRWVDAQERLDGMLEPLSTAAISKADPRPGERVIDVGCGCGATSVAMASRGAAVLGVDISAPMLVRSRERAEGADNLRFVEADAAVEPFPADHQLVFSRFGVMFFAAPMAAFANLRTALTGAGRLVFLCWQAPAANPWISVTGRAIQPFVPPPEAAPDPRAPGPFAFAEESYVCGLLDSAGFADIVCEPLQATLWLGASVAEVLEFQGQIGPVSRVLAELDEGSKAQALTAAGEALAEFEGPDGISLEASCWLVSAKNL